ncbi:MAG: PucR family transcriptional regulator ligand-binding domain-containing protein [Deinococcales bacterium]
MDVAQVLTLDIFKDRRLRSKPDYLNRPVRFIGVADHPDILPFVKAHQLVLTSGFSWPSEAQGQRELIAAMAQRNVAAIVMAVPKYFETIPEVACEEAERHQLALIEIPWEISFTQVILDVSSAILAEQYQVLEQAERLHVALSQAAIELSNLEDLAKILAKLVKHDVIIEDSEGQILGVYSFSLSKEAFSQEHSKSRPKNYLNHLQKSKSALYLSQKYAQPERMICPIYLRDEFLGSVAILASPQAAKDSDRAQELDELDTRAVEYAALIASLHIAQQRQVEQRQAQLGYTFLHALLEDELGEGRLEPEYVLERARFMSFDPSIPYRLGLFLMKAPVPLSAEGLTQRERLIKDIRSIFLQNQCKALLSPMTNRVFLLLPPKLSAERLWQGLNPSLREGHYEVAFLVSREHQGFAGVHQAYKEILPLLNHLHYGRLQRFEDLLIPSVLRGEVDAQKMLLKDVWGPFEEQGQLQETLIAFAKEGFSQKATAKRLGIHLNSLRYRLERITTLSQLKLDDPEERFRIRLAIELLSLKTT